MIAVDTNVLIYAHREELAQHTQALAWLKSLAEGSAPWGLPVFCVGEFVRVVTHPRVFDPPSTLEQATDALEALLARCAKRQGKLRPTAAMALDDAALRVPGTDKYKAGAYLGRLAGAKDAGPVAAAKAPCTANA